MPNVTVVKGHWIRAEWVQRTDGSLSGSQVKVAAKLIVVQGIVRHIRGDHPTNPKSIRLFVEPDNGGPEVIVNPIHVKDVRDAPGPLNQCEHPNAEEDGAHWYCSDCKLSFDAWGEGGVHGAEEREELDYLQERLKEWPDGTRRPSERYPGETLFTVRLYDMMDGWIDVLSKVSEEVAMDHWLSKTDYGKARTKYSDGDYYDIFPADTNMIVTPEFLGR
jgi:hypothetical protein